MKSLLIALTAGLALVCAGCKVDNAHRRRHPAPPPTKVHHVKTPVPPHKLPPKGKVVKKPMPKPLPKPMPKPAPKPMPKPVPHH